MGSACAFFTLFSLVLLVASSVDARKDQGEYWQVIMKDEPMPEAIEGLIIHRGSVSSPLSDKKTDCHTTTEAAANNNQLVNDSAEKKAFVKDFEPRPNVSAYHDDKVDLEGKPFVKDFEPRPDVSAYHDDEVDLKGKPFVNDFEPRPDVSAYHDDEVDLKGKPFVKDFEPRPDVSAYEH